MAGALRTNLDFLQTRGLQGLLALGSTGEFLHLEPSLRKQVMQELMRVASPWQVMMNISDIRPGVVMDLARFAHEVGAQGVSVLPPYYFPVAQEDLIEFFVRAGEAAQLPLFLYNFPERTGNRIALETIAAVADRVPVTGVKQSGAEFAYHSALVELGKKKGFVVLTGADTRLGEAVPLGVAGCVSGLSNAVPEVVAQALAGARNGGTTSSNLALGRMAELARRIETVNFPLDVAACMEARGLAVGTSKSIVSPASRAKYERLVAELRKVFGEWNLA